MKFLTTDLSCIFCIYKRKMIVSIYLNPNNKRLYIKKYHNMFQENYFADIIDNNNIILFKPFKYDSSFESHSLKECLRIIKLNIFT